jgi:hypothetical protein
MHVCVHAPGFDDVGKGWVCSASKGKRNVHLPEVVAVVVVVVVVEIMVVMVVVVVKERNKL